jgi:hypothetical protein
MRTAHTGATAVQRTGASWTPARIFLVASVGYHLPLGLAGFLYNRSFPIGPEAAAKAESAFVFGIFETNGWHSFAALAIGVVSLWAVLENRRVRMVALTIGALHVGIVLALIAWDPSVFWLASNNADQVIHSFTAVGGLVSGFATPRGSSVPLETNHP